MAIPHDVFIIGVKTFTAVSFVGGTIALFIRGLSEHGMNQAKISRIAFNSNAETKRNSIYLVHRAEKKIEMFDDGDNHPESVYNDQRFVDAIKKRLARGNFQVKCFFNEYDIYGLLFVKEVAGHKNVQIWRRPEGSRRPSDPHYKIIDRDIMGRIAWHSRGSQRRKYRKFDFRKVTVIDRMCLNWWHFTLIRQRRWPWRFKKFEAQNA